MKLITVQRKAPCAICGRPDWCGVTEDGALAICMRVPDGSIRESRNGGYVHVLIERPRNKWKPSIPLPPASTIAPIERRHAVYSALLDRLTMSGRHADDLLRRGLSDTEAARNLYGTMPDQFTAMRICKEMATAHDLSHVPGFYLTGPNWRFKAGAGMLIPVRDCAGLIQGCQIRRDTGEPRYLWFSSRDAGRGASPPADVHYARPWRVDSTGEAIVTEGPLKADTIADRLDACVIAVPGVTSFRSDFGARIKRGLPGLRHVFVAFDADWQSNAMVERALLRLFASIEMAGLECSFADWSETGAKGLDDLLNHKGVMA